MTTFSELRVNLEEFGVPPLPPTIVSCTKGTLAVSDFAGALVLTQADLVWDLNLPPYPRIIDLEGALRSCWYTLFWW